MGARRLENSGLETRRGETAHSCRKSSAGAARFFLLGRHWMVDGNLSHLCGWHVRPIMHNGKIYCHLTNGSKAWAVRDARMQICKLYHDDIGHLGVEKTLERIQRNY